MKQVVTPLDWLNAKFDYLIDQLNGRIRLEYPEFGDVIDQFIGDLSNEFTRMLELEMIERINQNVFTICSIRTECSLTGCPNERNHKFLEEILNLIWNSHHETELWLTRQGIVPGQSTS